MQLNWGIIGPGDIVRRHVAPAMSRVAGHRIAAVMRRNAAEAEAFAREFGAPRWYSDADALLNDPEVNAVFIGTPPASHAGMTLRAAAAGKHVLCEKPLACSAAEARAMIDGCRRHSVRLMVCHYQRYNARHRRLRSWVKDGVLGRIVSARIVFASYSPPVPGQWRRQPEISGGGPLMDLGSHCLDMLQYLCGPVERSEAVLGYREGQSVEDEATLLLRFRSGAHGTVSTYWTARVPEGTAASVELWGTEGSAAASPLQSKDSSGALVLHRPGGVEDHSLGPGPAIHDAVIEDFRTAIETGGPVLAPPEDALAGLEIIDRAYGR